MAKTNSKKRTWFIKKIDIPLEKCLKDLQGVERLKVDIKQKRDFWFKLQVDEWSSKLPIYSGNRMKSTL